MHVPVTDPSGVGQARRAGAALARRGGATASRVEAVALVLTELASNLVKHAGGGDLFFRSLPSANDGPAGFEVTSVDRGQGIADVAAAEHDGFSTARTAGTGLGAVRRASDRLEIHSVAGAGTVLRALFRPEATGRWEIGVISRPHPGEARNGDRLWIHGDGETLILVLVDALGHGPVAAEVSDRAEERLEAMARKGEVASATPTAVLGALHDALGGTRGAAVSVLIAHGDARHVDFAGIGNVTGRLVTPQSSRTFLGFPGIVGHRTRSLRETRYDWEPDGLLVLHTDGLSERWDLSDRPTLFGGSASMMAALLYQESQRRDDATVVVVRHRRHGSSTRRSS